MMQLARSCVLSLSRWIGMQTKCIYLIIYIPNISVLIYFFHFKVHVTHMCFLRSWRCITRDITQVTHRRLMRATAGMASLMLDSVRIHYACICHPNSWMSMKQSRTFKHLHQPAVLRPVQHVTTICFLPLYITLLPARFVYFPVMKSRKGAHYIETMIWSHLVQGVVAYSNVPELTPIP